MTSGQYLRGNGTNVVMSVIQAGDVPTLNQNTTGNAATATTLQTARLINGVSFNGSADITVADATKLPLAGGTMTGAISFAGSQTWPTFNQNTTGTASNVTGIVGVANGGTGLATLTANNVILGNGTSAVQTVAPGTAGNVLTSNGTTWISSAATGGSATILYKTANYTAVKGDIIYANTSGGAFTITLPATPAVGDAVTIVDYLGTFGASNVTIARNGQTIEDVASNSVLSNANTEYVYVYFNSTWKIYTKQFIRGVVSSIYLTGPTTANEGTEISLVIQGWSASATYTITVSGGTYVRNADLIRWTMPSVSTNTSHTLTITTSGQTYTHNVFVINLTTISDTSITITNFNVNSYNNGWV